jgi:hypothetical protein
MFFSLRVVDVVVNPTTVTLLTKVVIGAVGDTYFVFPFLTQMTEAATIATTTNRHRQIIIVRSVRFSDLN